MTTYRFNIHCGSLTVRHQCTVEDLVALLSEAENFISTDNGSRNRASFAQPDSRSQEPARALAWATLALAMVPTAVSRFALFPLLVTGVPIWRRALQTLVTERRLNVDFLDGLALAIAVLRVQPGTGALMAWMVHLGDVVRELTARKSRGHIRQLLDFEAVKARRVAADGTVILVRADDLQPNELVLMVAGDLVPADGEVHSGLAAVDQRHITGESVPATRGVGDSVYAGSSVVEGNITIRVTAAGAQTAAAKIVELIESAPVGETRIQNYAEKFADRLVAPLLGANLALLAATQNVDRFMSLAIVDYGTGIRVAAPTSVLASMTRAAREGILIKSGHHVEQLATLRGIAFDKTGTLTRGQLAILEVRVFSSGLTADQLLQLAEAPEAQLRHPVARALIHYARNERGLDQLPCENIEFTIGMGVSGVVCGKCVHVGSERYLRQTGIPTSAARNYLKGIESGGQTGLLVAIDNRLVGAIAYSDEPRPEALKAISGLRQRGVHEIVMLTGDRHGVANRIAQYLGIEKVFSEVLPHEKAEIVRTLRSRNGPFAMVGDGVNDSPALAQADVGISLGEGADIARDAADVVLMEHGIHRLLPAIDICREALALVRQNYTLIAAANTLALTLAVPTGLVSPMACTLLSNGSGLLAVLNGMRPLLMQKDRSLDSA